MPCRGGIISKVWGGGKGTVSGASGASFKGLSGTVEDFASGVAAVGDLEAIADLPSRLGAREGREGTIGSRGWGKVFREESERR
jgi:hypothetical protein